MFIDMPCIFVLMIMIELFDVDYDNDYEGLVLFLMKNIVLSFRMVLVLIMLIDMICCVLL